MTKIFEYSDAGTPLDSDEIEGLIPSHIVNRGQLDELEQENIVSAQLWLATARIDKINTDVSLRKLHKNMFGNVWRWAGTFRATGKNIGVEAYKIAPALKNLCDDVDTWIEFSSYPKDEIATRFHHRLLFIHPFPNGNGRHARLATDVLLSKQLNTRAFSWGRASIGNSFNKESGLDKESDTFIDKENINKTGDVRSYYINALRAADKGDYQALLAFVRS